jgi:hypothetical protein
MTDQPILFSAPMIRALLDGRKTQTRRILKPQPDDLYEGQIPRQFRIAIGDRLWVRESLTFDWTTNDWLYAADRAIMVDVCGNELETPRPDRWPRGAAPSIHMPRWASRLTLIVTDVRGQRLQEISEEDAIAEGMEQDTTPGSESFGAWTGGVDFLYGWDARGAFRRTWELINGAESVKANPWVAAYTFRVVKANIDSVPKGA